MRQEAGFVSLVAQLYRAIVLRSFEPTVLADLDAIAADEIQGCQARMLAGSQP